MLLFSSTSCYPLFSWKDLWSPWARQESPKSSVIQPGGLLGNAPDWVRTWQLAMPTLLDAVSVTLTPTPNLNAAPPFPSDHEVEMFVIGAVSASEMCSPSNPSCV